jgi:aminoglycoside phosphotransferase (APT) family kinase protein
LSPALSKLAGGVSNRTVLVEWPGGESWVLKQALPKLRVEVDWFSDPSRIRIEGRALRYLATLAPEGSITPLVFEDYGELLLAMQAVPKPHENWKTMLLAGQVDFGHVEQFARLLATIHGRAAQRGAEICEAFADTWAFESLRLEPYYLYTSVQVPQAAAFLNSLVADTRAARLTLVHGDYSPKNVLVHRDLLVLLDHEVAHFGDPAFDIGFSMAHFLSKAHHLPRWRERFRKAALLYWRIYSDKVSAAVDWPRHEEQAVRHSLGCTLARVAGRSKLEYLGAEERERQQAVVLRLMERRPDSIEAMVGEFLSEIDSYAHH